MHLPTSSLRRLTGVVAVACCAALVPTAALAATASQAGAGRAAVAAWTPRCTTRGLAVSVSFNYGGPSVGSSFYYINFTNRSGHTCTLGGFPGVSAASLGGRQLGSPALWDTAYTPHTVWLANGATTSAALQILETAGFCQPVSAAGLRVYPPNQFRSEVVPLQFSACSGSGPYFMNVAPLG